MSRFLDAAMAAIREAEKITLHYYHHPPKVSLKKDHTPVTIADRRAERAIIASLRKRFPDHQFLGEEYGQTGESDFLWIIDPIDGTKNFVGGIPLWGNLLALMHRGEVILGISNVPLMKERLWAEKGKGAFLNGKRVHVSSLSRLRDAMISAGSFTGFTKIGREKQIIRLLKTTSRQRSFGDLWPYHLLASGRLDIVTEAKIKIVDVAPFACIVPEAGGTITDLGGRPVQIGIKSIVATNKLLHDRTLKYFR
jgi:histidinol-phosphatase